MEVVFIILFFVLITMLTHANLCVQIKQMDMALNYSRKKKIKVNRIPLYFPNDRKNESKEGPTLENPNEGVYLPAFVCALVQYFIVLLAIVFAVLVLTEIIPGSMVMGFVYGLIALIAIYSIVIDQIRAHYERKYAMQKEFLKEEIRQILAQREKEENTSNQERKQI